MHLGGDEVVYGCWAEDDSITAYMKKHHITSYPDLLGLYVQKADAIVDKMDVSVYLRLKRLFLWVGGV